MMNEDILNEHILMTGKHYRIRVVHTPEHLIIYEEFESEGDWNIGSSVQVPNHNLFDFIELLKQ